MKREYPERPVAAAGAVVIRRAYGPSGGSFEILLIRRGVEPAIGKWSIPGGAIELGETARDAARRETREECGLDVAVNDIIGAFDVFVRDETGHLKFHYVIIDYLAEPVGGSIMASSDVSEARWVALEEAASLDITSGTREVLRLLALRGVK